MKQKINTLSISKHKVTKKQVLFILSSALVILVGCAVWAIRTPNTVTPNSAAGTSEIKKTADAKIEDLVSDDIAETSRSTSGETSTSSNTTQEPESQAPTPDELCDKGTYILENDTLKCTYSIDITQVPARLVVFAVETSPTYIQMFQEVAYEFTCAKATACTNESASSTPGRVQIAISEPTVVTVHVRQTTPYGSPVRTYSFQHWELTQGGPNYGDGSYPYTLLGKFTADI